VATEVLVPPLGQTVDTLTLVSWYKHEGEAVQQGEPLFAVETDKATLDVEAPSSGILRGVTASPGDEVKVLSAIAVIDEPGDGPGTSESARHVPQRVFVSPRARRLAESEGVPLAELKATGPQGAIVERDVRAYLAQRQAPLPPDIGGAPIKGEEVLLISPVARRMAEEAGLDWRSLAGTGPRGQITREDVERAWKQRTPDTQYPISTIPLSGVRGVIAERMAASHSQTAPVTLTAEADATALVELRRQLAADGVEVSYNDLLICVLAKALAEHPRLNASLDGDTIKVWSRIDVGLAVDTDRGLLVPVVRDVAHKGLAQLAAETKALAGRARAGQLGPDELTGSTFTLTNLGMFGVDAFTPIINLPECAVLGVGRIKTQPVWAGDHAEPRQMVWLSLTFDHRLVDGGPAARFLQRVVQLVEKPHLLMA